MRPTRLRRRRASAPLPERCATCSTSTEADRKTHAVSGAAEQKGSYIVDKNGKEQLVIYRKSEESGWLTLILIPKGAGGGRGDSDP